MNKGSKARKQNFPEYFQQSEENYGQTNPGEQTITTDGKPIQLIRIRPTGKIQIDPEALQIISSIDKPIGFVSIVGKAHTGKSTLLNRLLHLSNKGFQVDKTNSGGTKGIWMWSQPYENKTFDNCIIFLDTEGTDNLVKEVQEDMKIFILSLLLSSYLIYNSSGAIDQRTISELQLVVSLPKNIQISNQLRQSDNNQELYRIMPKLLWLVRDFKLQIQDNRGKVITHNQYLQNCLSQVNTIGRPNQTTKKIKKSILSYFTNRECLAMVHPVDDEQSLYHLNSLPDYALKKDFIAGLNTLRAKIMSNTGPKTYEGKNISGYQMATMIESYVQALNAGKIPNVKSAWQKISEDEGALAYNSALQKYEQIFHKQFPNQQPKGEQIYRILFNLKQQTIKEFQKQSQHNKNEVYLTKLKQFIQQKQQLIIEGNTAANEIKNVQILKNHSQELRSKIESHYYADSQNREQLKRDIEQVVKRYNKDAKGEKKGQIIAEFMSQLSSVVINDNKKTQNIKEQSKVKLSELQRRRLANQEQIKKKKRQLQEIGKPTITPKAPIIAKRTSNKDPKKGKDNQGGCCKCTGDKCLIM